MGKEWTCHLSAQVAGLDCMVTGYCEPRVSEMIHPLDRLATLVVIDAPAVRAAASCALTPYVRRMFELTVGCPVCVPVTAR
jgi:hypothetical protein